MDMEFKVLDKQNMGLRRNNSGWPTGEIQDSAKKADKNGFIAKVAIICAVSCKFLFLQIPLERFYKCTFSILSSFLPYFYSKEMPRLQFYKYSSKSSIYIVY